MNHMKYKDEIKELIFKTKKELSKLNYNENMEEDSISVAKEQYEKVLDIVLDQINGNKSPKTIISELEIGLKLINMVIEVLNDPTIKNNAYDILSTIHLFIPIMKYLSVSVLPDNIKESVIDNYQNDIIEESIEEENYNDDETLPVEDLDSDDEEYEELVGEENSDDEEETLPIEDLDFDDEETSSIEDLNLDNKKYEELVKEKDFNDNETSSAEDLNLNQQKIEKYNQINDILNTPDIADNPDAAKIIKQPINQMETDKKVDQYINKVVDTERSDQDYNHVNEDKDRKVQDILLKDDNLNIDIQEDFGSGFLDGVNEYENPSTEIEDNQIVTHVSNKEDNLRVNYAGPNINTKMNIEVKEGDEQIDIENPIITNTEINPDGSQIN